MSRFRRLVRGAAFRLAAGVSALAAAAPIFAEAPAFTPPPASARLVLEEDWSGGAIDPQRWYVMRRHWGNGHHGVVPENVRIAEERDEQGERRRVLICRAQGDLAEGPARGLWNRPQRVGGVIASKAFFASGRFEVEMRVGGTERAADGPADPTQPAGTIPAIWVYAGWNVRVPPAHADHYVPEQPLYQPYLQEWGRGNAHYWSELDFPELGKGGDFRHGLYNTFNHKRSDSRTFALPVELAGRFHTYTTEWRTELAPLEEIRDSQVIQHQGWHWVRDLKFPFESYLGNPLRKLGPDHYAVHRGVIARHWIDGKFVGENTKFVPCIAAQLTLGVWLPDWAGPAPWKKSSVAFGRIRVWQYDDPGDVRGLLTNDQPDNFTPDGARIEP